MWKILDGRSEQNEAIVTVVVLAIAAGHERGGILDTAVFGVVEVTAKLAITIQSGFLLNNASGDNEVARDAVGIDNRNTITDIDVFQAPKSVGRVTVEEFGFVLDNAIFGIDASETRGGRTGADVFRDSESRDALGGDGGSLDIGRLGGLGRERSSESGGGFFGLFDGLDRFKSTDWRQIKGATADGVSFVEVSEKNYCEKKKKQNWINFASFLAFCILNHKKYLPKRIYTFIIAHFSKKVKLFRGL